jgi:hypothetical protein
MASPETLGRESRPGQTSGWFKLDHRRLACLAFAVVEAVALPVYMLLGRGMWFWHDEWDFLAARSAGDLGDLFRPHGNVHLMTLPILVYRMMWNVWGITTYLPYQLLIVVLHLVCALLIRTVMRRIGVRPWTATVVASLFVFFGAGSQNILWPVAISWVGAVVFGLAHLLLADHDGPFDRRDLLGLLAGVAALLCSAVGIAMVLAVGVAMFMRRGWRIALIHTVPLGLLYVLWWATLARSSYELARQANPTSPSQVIRFIPDTVANTFRALGQVSGVGILLGFLLLVGLGLAWRSLSRDELRARAAVPVALTVAALVFLGLTGFGRGATGAGASERGRYLYVVAALLLPALAVAADAVIRRWVALAPVVLALFVVGIPGNLHAAVDYAQEQRATSQLFRRTQLTLPRLPLAQQVPRSHIPQTGPHYYYVTIGWLLDGVASGRIPEPRVITRAGVATDKLRLSLSRYAKPIAQLDSNACVSLHGSQSQREIELRLDTGQQMRVNHAVIRLVPASGPTDPAFPLELDGRSGVASTVAIRNGTAFRVQSESVVATDAQVCAPRGAFNGAAVPAAPSSPRSPDTPTFCSTAVDIQEFFARMPSEKGSNPRPDIARRIDEVLLPLLAKAQHSAPVEVVGAVETFTQAIRRGLFTGKNQFGQPAVLDAGRNINSFMVSNCGYPGADIMGGLE